MRYLITVAGLWCLTVRLSYGQVPDIPANVRIETSTTNVSVSWNSASLATGYEIWRATTQELSQATVIAKISGSVRYQDTAWPPETEFFYWVRATNVVGVSGFSQPVKGHRRTAASL